MCRVINLAEYRKAKEEDVEELIRIVKSYPFDDKKLEEERNYYLEQYLQRINF